jgi:hypothetical protein
MKRRSFPRFRREDSEELVLQGVVAVLGGLKGHAGDEEQSNRAYVYAVTLALRYVVELPPVDEGRAEAVSIAERVARLLMPKKAPEKPVQKVASVTCMHGWRPRSIVAGGGGGHGPDDAA